MMDGHWIRYVRVGVRCCMSSCISVDTGGTFFAGGLVFKHVSKTILGGGHGTAPSTTYADDEL